MLIIVLIVATALMVSWLVLLGMVTREDWIAAAYNKVLDNIYTVDRFRMKDAERREWLSQYHGIMGAVMSLFPGGTHDKEIAKLERISIRLRRGDLRPVNVFVMPGYVIQRKYEPVGRGNIHKMIHSRSLELYGKKHAANRAAHLLACILSYSMIGTACSLGIGAAVMGLGNMTAGAGVLGAGTVLTLVLNYAMYDELNDRVNKRRDAIKRQLPNVVSKLALLVTSGMIVDRAWKETAGSAGTELYQEMRKTSDELDNLISPEAAYGGFLDRCNTKETAKLASAIMQNLSKGNAEIGRLLKDMAHEAWQERRHIAKRDAEKANSKLMIPTMLLLIAILIMIMVPVAMNFSSL